MTLESADSENSPEEHPHWNFELFIFGLFTLETGKVSRAYAFARLIPDSERFRYLHCLIRFFVPDRNKWNPREPVSRQVATCLYWADRLAAWYFAPATSERLMTLSLDWSGVLSHPINILAVHSRRATLSTSLSSRALKIVHWQECRPSVKGEHFLESEVANADDGREHSSRAHFTFVALLANFISEAIEQSSRERSLPFLYFLSLSLARLPCSLLQHRDA